MRMRNINISILALLLSSVILIEGKATEENSSKENSKGKDTAKVKEFYSKLNKSNQFQEKPDDEKVRALIKVKQNVFSEEEHIIQNLSKKAYAEIERFGIFAIAATYKELQELQGEPSIESIEPDGEVFIVEELLTESAIEKYGEIVPWGIDEVLQDRNFWDTITPVSKMKICVCDTGYDLGHEDLPIAPDVVGSDNPDFKGKWSSDLDGHGTHVAGTIAAIGNNNKGVTGVIPNNKGGNFQLIITKALDSTGEGYVSSLLKALDDCVSNGANIISLSLGSESYSKVSAKVYQDLYDQGILIVASSNNSGNDKFFYPASYSTVISIAAVDSDLEHFYASTYNSQVELAGPGVDVLSTSPRNSYSYLSGTSMASPHIASVAGLIWMQFPTCTNDQIRNVLADSALDLDSSGCDVRTGYGLVQAKNAYNLLSFGDCGGYRDVKNSKGGCNQLGKKSMQCSSNSDCDDNDPCTKDLCRLGKCVSKLQCSKCGKSKLEVNVLPDLFPQEVSWAVTKNNIILMAGGPYPEAKLYSDSKCFGSGKYKFTIYDEEKDGICCEYGIGHYDLTVGNKLLKSGGKFAELEKTTFTIP